jgi:signal transduction histidine kinase
VQPNAGLPRTVDGRLLYMATPEYLDVFARRTIQLGATMIGGYPGPGLGLAIAKGFIESNGGRVWVEPRRGSGTTFFVELPEQGAAGPA